MKFWIAAAFAATLTSAAAAQPPITPAMRPYVVRDAATIAIRHVRVIDGTGRPALADRTVILRNGKIASIEPDAKAIVPAGADTIDGRGMSLLPGLVQMHEHMWTEGPYGMLSVTGSYPRLLLAAGVTSARSPGSYDNYADLKLARMLRDGSAVGPWLDMGLFMGDIFGMPALKTPADAATYVNFWLDAGFTSIKAYRRTNLPALKTAIDIAHRRGLKVTGHLCAVTYGEAAELGIDNVEHGFIVATDFMKDKPADRCPEDIKPGIADIDPRGPAARALINKLVAHKVAVTSTLVTFARAGRSSAEDGTALLTPPLKAFVVESLAQAGTARRLPESAEVRHSAIMEREFLRAGGLLISGTDIAVPGLIAGYASARQMELMVELGFTPLEAIKVSTLNGAIYLGRDNLVGSISPGKQADLVLVRGDPSTTISDFRNVQIVFKQGLGYDPGKLRDSVRGTVGLQ